MTVPVPAVVLAGTTAGPAVACTVVVLLLAGEVTRTGRTGSQARGFLLCVLPLVLVFGLIVLARVAELAR